MPQSWNELLAVWSLLKFHAYPTEMSLEVILKEPNNSIGNSSLGNSSIGNSELSSKDLTTKEQIKIPTGKIERAARFAKTGVKVGGNYLKHFAKQVISGEAPREELHQSNARDIFAGLSELKGGALKVLQMLSVDQNLLPAPYVEKFAHAQYSVPPLSYPLVVATFRKQLGASPEELFDSFTQNAVNAASMGQVHKATKGGMTLAVKVQYPGVADSLVSDLRIARPFAARLFNVSDRDIDYFFAEVRDRLLEETDYRLELARSQRISSACQHLPALRFPRYFPELSGERIITMEWLEGVHLPEFLASGPEQETLNAIGQALWDFYDFQIHTLKEVHADPHPGNFLFSTLGGVGVSNDESRRDSGAGGAAVGVLDFGCVKEIPDDFYSGYFQFIRPGITRRASEFDTLLRQLRFLHEHDSAEEIKVFTSVFAESIELLSRPFQDEYFDFGDGDYFAEIHAFGERLSKMEELRRSKSGRGPRDSLYISRSYFGLYNLLHSLRAKVKTNRPDWLRY